MTIILNSHKSIINNCLSKEFPNYSLQNLSQFIVNETINDWIAILGLSCPFKRFVNYFQLMN